MSEYLDYIADVQDVQSVINDLALNMYKQGRVDERAKVIDEIIVFRDIENLDEYEVGNLNKLIRRLKLVK